MSITAICLPHTVNNKVLRWSSSEESVAIVESTDKVTSINDSKCIISATTKDGSNLTAICDIEVDSKVYVTSVDVTPKALIVYVSEQGQLRASVTPTNATNPSLTWSSSDSNIASVDSNGKVSAIAEGKCTIRVPSVEYPTKYAESVVQVGAKTFN